MPGGRSEPTFSAARLGSVRRRLWACFGEGCTPARVIRTPDGRWLVPQSAPFLMPPVRVTSVFVDAVDSSGVRVARVLPIETEPTGERPDGPECGGPVRFNPVQVPPG